MSTKVYVDINNIEAPPPNVVVPVNKDNSKITELRTILQRESQNS
jgi:hypothetical protein